MLTNTTEVFTIQSLGVFTRIQNTRTMKHLIHRIVILSAILSFFGLAFLSHGQQPLIPSNTPYVRHEWEPPSDQIVEGSYGNNGVAQWCSPKPFEELWAYYAKKLLIEQPYRANFNLGMSDHKGVTRSIKNYSNIRGELLATLIRRDSQKNITVCLASTGSGTTIVFVTIQQNPQ